MPIFSSLLLPTAPTRDQKCTFMELALVCARPTGSLSNFAASKFRKVALSSAQCYV